MISPQTVLDFWFGRLGHDAMPDKQHQTRWWQKSQAFDANIKRQFESTLQAVADGKHNDWFDDPKGRLAAIIVLDQFPRNCYRNTPQAFAYDSIALELSQTGIAQQFDKALVPIYRVFFYMPLEHAESIGEQVQSVELFAALRQGASAAHQETFDNYYHYAKAHYDIIARFGRFVHRNAILNRPSTAEEKAFLQLPNSAF